MTVGFASVIVGFASVIVGFASVIVGFASPSETVDLEMSLLILF
jgi:ABC-type uncharacterized transport system permease subunit